MAKEGKGLPYLVQAIKDGPNNKGKDAIREAFLSLSMDVSKLINSYYSVDWPIVAAAMIIAGESIKAGLPPAGQDLVNDIMDDTSAIRFTYAVDDAGGVSNSMKEAYYVFSH